MDPVTSFNQAVAGRRWKSSLLTLYREPVLLISSIVFPCGAYHNASAAFEQEPADCCESVCGGVCFCCGFDLRSRFREKYNLRGNEGQDFCIHCWCNCCGLAQIQREAQLWSLDGVHAKGQWDSEPGPSKGRVGDGTAGGEIPLIERTGHMDDGITPEQAPATPSRLLEDRFIQHKSSGSQTPTPQGALGATTKTALELGDLMDRFDQPSGDLGTGPEARGKETAADLVNGKKPVEA